MFNEIYPHMLSEGGVLVDASVFPICLPQTQFSSLRLVRRYRRAHTFECSPKLTLFRLLGRVTLGWLQVQRVLGSRGKRE